MDEPDTPTRLLSLDSGEARGLAELFILRELMARVNKTRRKSDKLEPWQLFDLIAGNSTGGLIALMLGRLHMSVDECISAYMDISEAMFKPKQSKWNALRTPNFRSTLDEQTMQDIIRKRSASYRNVDDLMWNPVSPCKVFVVTSQADTGRPCLLRSYGTPQFPSPTINCKIWEAARATTTNSPLFGGFRFEAKGSIAEFGASDFYNPVGNVYHEARILWPEREIILVSIGAGAAPRNKFSGRLGASIEAVERISARAEDIALAFQLQQTGTSTKTSLYRFSAQNLADIGLEEHDAGADVEAATNSYLGRMEMQDRLCRCVGDLSEINYEEKSDAVKQLELQRAYELEIRKFADWLSPINMSARQNDVIAKLQEGTGTSLLATSEYQSWLHGETKTLVCIGAPGSGKTVLASQVIDILLQDGEYKDNPVLYFFADFRTQRTEQQTPASIVANLLKQLIYHNRHISDQTRRFFERLIKERNRPTAEGLLAYIERETMGTRKIFVVIDALDELADSCREELLSYLRQLQMKCTMSLMATSRPNFRTIQLFAEMYPGYRSLQIRQTQEDIEAYLAGQMHRLPDVVMRDTDLQEYIKTEIMSRSHGVFLFAKLLLESLIGKVTVRGIKSTLSSLPLNLHDIYETMFRRLEEQDQFSRDLAFKAFTWLSYAQRPMTALEIQHALAVESGKGRLDVENLVDIEELISACGGLVAVSAESNIITFIHITVGEYFRDQRDIRMANGQLTIASTCLTYLCFDCFAGGRCANDEALQQRLKENPFLEYASHFWGCHIQTVSPGDLADLALKLLTHDGKISSCSQIMLLPDSHTPPPSETSPNDVSGLHLVAYFDIIWLARLLLDLDLDICATDSWGRDPLAWAVEYNHFNMATLFLDSGAEIELRDNQGRTHLALAAMDGYRDIADELLTRGADPSVRDDAGQTALSLAATHGHLLLVRLLLGIPSSEVDARDTFGRTALFCAADQGHDSVVACLVVQAGVDINAQNNMGATPLITSARRGQTGVVKTLLEQTSIIPNMKDRSGRTAIMWAAIEGHIEVLQLLLSREDAIEALNSADYSGRSPLDWAVTTNQVSIIELLSSRVKVGDKIQ